MNSLSRAELEKQDRIGLDQEIGAILFFVVY